MKRTIAMTVLLASSGLATAAAPGGPGCGWGNMLFQGQSGLGPHLFAATTNGTSGNASFGLTFGTNGCDAGAVLTYDGKAMVDLSGVLDDFSEDVAMGNGEAINAVAGMYGIEDSADVEAFASLTHNNFETLFPSADVTAEQVSKNLYDLLKSDASLSAYVA